MDEAPPGRPSAAAAAMPADAAVPPPILEMRGVSKRFGSTQALDDVSLVLHAGEIHALLGENGAGKSTLIKVLTGVHSLDGGTVTLNGTSVRFTSPSQAQQAGVSTVAAR